MVHSPCHTDTPPPILWGAVIVLFKPDIERVKANVELLLEAGGSVVLVDNSPVPSSFLELERMSCHILINQNHGGIAGALNRAACWANEQKLQWLLTMDQDSQIDQSWLQPILHLATAAEPNWAIVTPYHQTDRSVDEQKIQEVPVWRVVRDTMTSGNLLRLSAWNKVGQFDEALFIDHVDHDFCLRLNRHNWLVVELRSAEMIHLLGEITYRRFLYRRRQPISNHSPLRRYTITRNRIEVVRRHGLRFPLFAWREWSHFWLELLLILCFEKNRQIKIKMVVWGVRDALLRRLGPPSENVVALATASERQSH